MVKVQPALVSEIRVGGGCEQRLSSGCGGPLQPVRDPVTLSVFWRPEHAETVVSSAAELYDQPLLQVRIKCQRAVLHNVGRSKATAFRYPKYPDPGADPKSRATLGP